MLVQFSVRNYKLFKEEACLSLVASNYDKTHEDSHVFDVPALGLRLLKSALIYGANASGKSKLIDAAHFMRDFVLNSSKETQLGETIGAEPFRLDTVSAERPSFFEILFVHEGELFRYGFEVTPQAVVAEWLYYRPKTKEIEVFYREGQDFQVHERQFKKGKLLIKESLVRSNALMLSVAAQFNDPLAEKVLAWFRSFRQLDSLEEDTYLPSSMGRATEGKAKMLALLKLADIGIEDIAIKTIGPDDLPKEMPDELKALILAKVRDGAQILTGVKTYHSVYDEAGGYAGQAEFSLDREESSGTKKFFALLGPLLDALEKGTVLFVDEMDAKLHPELARQLLALFHSPESNPRQAQLVFNTHSTNFLKADLLRRDQVWFVDKDRYGAASLYSLDTFKSEGVRRTDNFEEGYLAGRYGGVPVLGDFSRITGQFNRIEE